MLVTHVRVPVVCRGILLDRDDDDKLAGLYRVHIYSSPKGEINEILARLSFNPGCDDNFKTGMHVFVIVEYIWDSVKADYLDYYQNGTNIIIGQYRPNRIIPITAKNPNLDIDGGYVQYINSRSESGLVAEDSGAVRLITNGLVLHEMSPQGDGMLENIDRSFAQNFIRIISNMEPYHVAREYFGLYNGKDLQEKISNASSPDDQLIAYKRFVPQCRQPDVWVSTNEGAYCPWVGSNNEVEEIQKNKEIIYNKIINYQSNRITIHAGETGSGFYTFRIDKLAAGTLKGEKLKAAGGDASPVMADTVFYLGISEEGEIKAEFGINPKTKKAAATLTVTKDGSVDLSVGAKFTVNGKPIVTKDFIDFMQKHQADLVQVSAIGAPAPMSPSAAPDFSKGQRSGNFLTDQASNTLVSASPFLEST